MSRMGEYAMEMEQLQQWERQKELEEMEQICATVDNWWFELDRDKRYQETNK